MSTSLSSCVSSLRSTTALLSSTITILDNGVNDFPRLAKVLQTTRHFDLLPEPSLHNAQSQLLASLTPELDILLARIGTQLDRLERKSQALMARSELLEGRIGEGRGGSGGVSSVKKGGRGEEKGGEGGGERGGGGQLEQKRRQLRAKRERLGYVVERLELQAKQKQRQLRMSVAAT